MAHQLVVPILPPKTKADVKAAVVADLKSDEDDLIDLTSFFVSARTGLEGRDPLPGKYVSRYPFVPAHRPVVLLTREERSSLDALVMAHYVLALVDSEKNIKLFSPEIDTIATMGAELLTLLSSKNATKTINSIHLKPEALSFSGMPEGLAYAVFGRVDGVDAPKDGKRIPTKYQTTLGSTEEEKKLAAYKTDLTAVYNKIRGRMPEEIQAMYDLTGNPYVSVALLETRIVAMAAHLIINRNTLFRTNKYWEDLKKHEELMMRELKTLLQYYAHTKLSKK